MPPNSTIAFKEIYQEKMACHCSLISENIGYLTTVLTLWLHHFLSH